jgi:hypothetical protein
MGTPDFPTCMSCAGRIGAYEPLWWRRPDGSVVTTSFLHARDDPYYAHPRSEFFHADCLAGAE